MIVRSSVPACFPLIGVDVGTAVGTGVFVGVCVAVGTGVLVGVGVAVGIGVLVGVGVGVAVGAGVRVGVCMGVRVGAGVFAALGGSVALACAVGVCVGANVRVAVGAGVSVGMASIVGAMAGRAARGVAVGTGVGMARVGVGAAVGGGVAVGGAVGVGVGNAAAAAAGAGALAAVCGGLDSPNNAAATMITATAATPTPPQTTQRFMLRGRGRASPISASRSMSRTALRCRSSLILSRSSGVNPQVTERFLSQSPYRRTEGVISVFSASRMARIAFVLPRKSANVCPCRSASADCTSPLTASPFPLRRLHLVAPTAGAGNGRCPRPPTA